jgi:OOP family OmpA-OmpF porin
MNRFTAGIPLFCQSLPMPSQYLTWRLDMRTTFARSAIAAVLFAPALAAPATAGDVKMFDHPPTLSEVQELLAAPAPAPVPAPATAPRYRSIEIIGGAMKSVQNNAPAPATAPAAYTPSDAPRQVMPAPVMAPKPIEESSAVASAQDAATPREENHRSSDQAAFGFRINFAFNSAVIPSDAYEYLDTVGTVLHQEPDIAIVVEGHTDATGAESYNQTLSERRAKAVENYLVQKHQITVARIHAVGKGEAEPLTANAFYHMNRRVQFARAN